MTQNRTNGTSLVWFRRDLRLDDNPALHAAIQSGRPLVLLFLREPDRDTTPSPGRASDWWLHHSLTSLQQSVQALGGRLVFKTGDAETAIPAIARECRAQEVFWNRRQLPWLDERDADIALTLRDEDIRPHVFRGTLLDNSLEVLNGQGAPYRVFSAFWRAFNKTCSPDRPLPAPAQLHCALTGLDSEVLDQWKLLPRSPDWASGFTPEWLPGEAGARIRLESFLKAALAGYKENRDRPDIAGTSRLSPHLAWGEISPRAVWHLVRDRAEQTGQFKSAEKFLAEIGWREFAYYLFHHFGDLRRTNFNRDFDRFPWREDPAGFTAWCKGLTGVPMVDAAMRELWTTGWMHNRSRMIVASYLIKHIGCHWEDGMRWFEDTLVDSDIAINTASWQWVAGSGADAAPYFRIFNPSSQGEKFDPSADYVRKWVPEIADLPDRYIHAPWDAPASVRMAAGLRLGESYPQPAVGLSEGRERALAAYRTMKERRDASEDA